MTTQVNSDYQGELHDAVHPATMDWYALIQEGVSPSYYLSAKAFQAVKCIAFAFFCEATKKDQTETDADVAHLHHLIYLISLGAGLQAAITDGDIAFNEDIEDVDGGF